LTGEYSIENEKIALAEMYFPVAALRNAGGMCTARKDRKAGEGRGAGEDREYRRNRKNR
jgi:hypothetical protein